MVAVAWWQLYCFRERLRSHTEHVKITRVSSSDSRHNFKFIAMLGNTITWRGGGHLSVDDSLPYGGASLAAVADQVHVVYC